MRNKKFKDGMIIKGRDLKRKILCKILSEDMVMDGFQYKIGINVDHPLESGKNRYTGMHFYLIEDACDFFYLKEGTKLAIVKIPDDENVYVQKSGFRISFNAHILDIQKIMSLSEITTWRYLHENGTDLTMDNNYPVIWAATNGYLDVVKYLHENGADITANGNWAVISAAEYGHLEIVKYLYESGADITAEENDSVIWAAYNGHLEIVKYLHENEADLTARDNVAVVYAAGNGHLEIVRYLHENGADITVRNNLAIRCALDNGHLKVVEYILSQIKL